MGAARKGLRALPVVVISKSKKWETDFYRFLPLPGIFETGITPMKSKQVYANFAHRHE